jgi:hypothetical protein
MDRQLSPASAADLLHVPLEEILGELLASPDEATMVETQEFRELPDPTTTRRKGRTLTA